MSVVYSLEAKQIIHAIVADMRTGTVPADVPDFQSLHLYVDANEYFLQETDIFDEAFGDAQFKTADEVAAEVTWWLQHTNPNMLDRIAARPLI